MEVHANILVVDDNKSNLVAMRHLLCDFDVNVFECTSGKDALTLAEMHEFSIIILDVQMPLMDGYETAIRLRSDPKTSEVPIIFVTAIYKEDQYIFKGYESGAVDFLLKPINPIVFCSKVRVFLKLFEQRKSIENKSKKLEVSLVRLELMQSEIIRREKLASLGLMVAGIAHEINTPLGNGITGISTMQSLLENLKNKIQETTMENVVCFEYLNDLNVISKIILEQLQSAAFLITNFKQIAVDQSSPDIRKILVREYLESIKITYQKSFKTKKIDFVINVSSQIEMVTCPGALTQVLSILISNCLMHAFEDLKVLKHKIIEIKVEEKNNDFLIFISDNGVGIPSKQIDKIFEPFYTTKRGDGGSGLGLSIAHNIVTEILKGSLVCKSVMGQGSVFIINTKNLNDVC